MQKIIYTLLFLLLAQTCFTQTHFCGTDSIYLLPQNAGKSVFRNAALKEILKWRDAHKGDFKRYKRPLPSLRGSGCEQVTFYIPVVVHIVHLPSDSLPGMGSNISDAQVLNAIELLNRGFGNANGYGSPAVNTGIKFCLATRKPDGSSFSGIIRTASYESNHTYPDSVGKLKKFSIFPAKEYLNIYVVNNLLDLLGAQTGVLGYGLHPSVGIAEDGLVMRADYFGDYQTCTGCNINSSSRGRVLIHEMGHYLGLYHPWNNSCAGNTSSTCSTDGDYCCDVPQTKQAITSCNNLLTTDCYSPPKSVQINNFMDYAPDACAYFFTNDQADLMAATLNTIRQKLCSKQNLDSTGVQCCIRTAWFSANQSVLCRDSTVTFLANKYIGHTYHWKIYRNDTFVTTLTDTTGKHNFSTNLTGNYSVWLQINKGTDTIGQYRTDLFKIGDCTKKVKSHNGNWYFGDHAGVKFYDFAPFFDQGPRDKYPNINNSEATICLSDSGGNLLFYSGRRHLENDTNYVVFGKDYRRMSNPLIYGHQSSAQGGVAFRVPGSSKRYYIITTYTNIDNNSNYDLKEVRYNIIDMDSAGGLGNVLTQFHNKPIIHLKSPEKNPIDKCIKVKEGIAAVPSCNDSFYWVAVIGKDSIYKDFYWQELEALMIFKVSATGITHHKSYELAISPDAFSHLTFSMDGRQLGNPFFLADFDPASGFLSRIRYNQYHIDNYSDITLYDASFSPDGSKFYYCTATPDSNQNNQLYQIDVQDKNPFVKRQLVLNIPASYSRFQGLQLGPDNKLYLGIAGTEYLSTINNSDADVKDVDVDMTNVYLGNGNFVGRNNSGLPNNIDASFETVNKLGFTATRDGCRKFKFNSINTCRTGTQLWKFGDGTTDTSKAPSHAYASAGEYTVTLFIGSDSVVKTVNTGIVAAMLAGDTLICDTSTTTLYNMPYRSGVVYNWSAINGTVSPMGHEAYVKWNDTFGSLKLKITDAAAGCIDSTVIHIHKTDSIYNNIISLNLKSCDVVRDSFLVTGTQSGGAGTSPNYYWYWKGQSDTQWKTPYISFGKTGKFQYRDSIFQIMRVAQSGSCYAYSNIVLAPKFKITNSLTKESGNCSPSGNTIPFNTRANGYIYKPVWIVNPTQPYKLSQPISVAWQYSYDSLNWIENQYDSIIQHSYDVTTFDSFMFFKKMYLRRALVCDNLSSYSNIVKFERPYFNKPPSNIVLCKSNRTLKDTVSMQWYSTWDKSYIFQIFDNGWKRVTSNTTGIINAVITLDTGTYLYRVIAKFNDCDSTISDTAKISVVGGNVNITSVSNNTSAGTGVQINLVTTRNRKDFTYFMWQRSKNPEGGKWDSIGKTQSDTFKVTPTFTSCQQKLYYRAILRNLCPATNQNFLSASKTSKAIQTGTYQPDPNNSDLWIPDSRRDVGNEPNWIDSNNYTGSYYLWSRNWATKYQRVWDWLDREAVQTDRDTNFIHFMVYNRGDMPASEAKIYLYWTVMSVNEDWPYSWTGMSLFENTDSANGSNGSNKFNSSSGNKKYPMGGRMNKSAINLSTFLNQTPAIPSHPAYAGQLQPGDSILVTYPWVQSDTVPKPGWYYGKVNGQHRYANWIGMCLLARMLECDTPNYGLTFPEKLRYADSNTQLNLGYKSNIGYNIINNNNIVSENFFLGYMQAPFTDTTQVWILGTPKKQDDSDGGSGGTGMRDVKYTLCVDEPQFYDHAETVVTLSDELWDYLSAANFPGNGFNANMTTHQLIVNSPCAEIGPVSLPDSLESMLGFAWRYLPSNNQYGTPINALFNLKQYNENELIGITEFGIKGCLTTGGGNGHGDAPSPLNTILSDKSDAKFSVRPNPFNQYIDVEYQTLPLAKVKIQLFDASGKLVKDICDCKADENGNIKVKTSTTHLKAGTYIVKLWENGILLYEKVIKNN